MTDQDRADTIDVLDGYENIGYPWAKDIYSDWTEFVEGYGREKAEEILKQAEIDWPPESVSIDISTKCNLRCPMCMSNGDAEGRAQYTKIQFDWREIADFFIKNGAKTLFMGSLGESFLKKDTLLFMDAVKDHVRDFAFSTNATAVDPAYIAEIAKFNVSSIRISCDAGDPISYPIWRLGADYETFETNVREFVKYFGDKVFIHSVLFKENMDSIRTLPEFAQNLGVKTIEIHGLKRRGATIRNGLHATNLQETCSVLNEIFAKEKKTGVKAVTTFILPDEEMSLRAWMLTNGRIGSRDFQHTVAEPRCHEPWRMVNIAHHGELSPCCGGFEGQKLNGHPFKTDVEKIINARAGLMLRALTIAGHTPTVCKFFCRKDYTGTRVKPPHSRHTVPVPAPLTAKQIELAYEGFFQDTNLPFCDLNGAIGFLENLSAASPSEQGSVIKQQLLPLLRPEVPQNIQKQIIRKLTMLAGDTGLTEPFDKHDDHVIETVFRPFLNQVNEKPGGKRTVLFVATTPYFVILRQAIYLRKLGYRVFLLSLSRIPENLGSMFEEHFDLIANTSNSYRLMKKVLGLVSPDIVHVQCWMWMYVLGRLAIEQCKNSKVVCEFYDATSLFADRDDLLDKWQPKLVDLDLTLEGKILREADAIVSRYGDDVAEAWMKKHKAKADYVELQPYPCPEFIHYSTSKAKKAGDPIRLIHAGSLTSPDDEHPETLYPERSTPETFKTLLQQGLAIDVFCPPHLDPTKLGHQYETYSALAREFEHFRFLKGVPPDQFAKAIADYDYGILFFDYDPATARLSDLWMKGVMPTRFFSYMEAGIPGLVISEYQDMTRLLEDNGLGLGIPSKELKNLSTILQTFDRKASVENIKRYNQEHGMDKEINRLTALYDRVLA